MTGREYLQNIKEELQAGHWQHKKGASILAAFGYARRRKAALAAINKELKRLGLKADPPIDEGMPLDSSHVSFSLVEEAVGPRSVKKESATAPVGKGGEEPGIELPIPTFKVHDLDAADKHVECIKANETLSKAYTIMLKHKYSQLVVADTNDPLSTAIKGAITYQSIADALINGPAKTVIDCLDKTTPQVSVDDDIDRVITSLAKHDVVLVIGPDKRLSGIVTAWDLAVEFAELVGPFKWIGEIESRIRECVRNKLGASAVVSFLVGTTEATLKNDPEMLNLGDLVRIVQNPDNWRKLGLPLDRQEFSKIMDETREYRNRLMHFRDPLNQDEKRRLQNYCEMVRKIC
jgi:CBS domain-containing protein